MHLSLISAGRARNVAQRRISIGADCEEASRFSRLIAVERRCHFSFVIDQARCTGTSA
jgi:hypothetical protein